jgi:transcription initiation factor TFIIH subunit 3
MAPTTASGDDDSSLLLLCVETNPSFWESTSPTHGVDTVQDVGLVAFMQHLLVFINAFVLLHASNQLVVCALHSDGCHLLYQSLQLQLAQDGGAGAAADLTAAPSSVVAAKVGALPQGGAIASPTPLSGGLSRVLSYAHRAMMRDTVTGAPQQARILCMHGSTDSPRQYVATMNAIFCAQNMRIPIDVCLLGPHESPFLQQAASLTGGLYMRPPRPRALAQYLITVFSPDPLSRTALRLPQAKGVDFRASCFCHKRALDIGFVCSVCLSIYCAQCKECATCGAEYTDT